MLSLPTNWSDGQTVNAAQLNQILTAFRTQWLGGAIASPPSGVDDTAEVRAVLASGAGGSCYFPAGTYAVDPVTAGRLAVASGTTVFGDGLRTTFRVKGGVGNYSAMFGPVGADFTAPMTDVTFRDFVVDQNVAGNPAQVASSAGAYQMAILSYAPTRVRVERVTFNDACGLNTIMLMNDASVGSTVRDCTFRFTKNGTTAYDESAVYIHGEDWEVSGCRFYGTALSNDAMAAIDCHGGNCRVFGNRIYNYFVGVNVVSRTTDTHGIQVQGNIIDACGYGIALWSLTGQAITGASVCYNNITVANATRGAVSGQGLLHAGIQLYDGPSGSTAHSGSFANVLIHGNVIVAQKENRTIAQPADCYGIGLRPKGVISDVKVTGNIIRNFPSLGAFLYNATSAKRVVVTDNQFIDCGNDTNVPWYYRIGFLFGGEGLEDVHVDGNFFLDSGPVGSPLGGQSVNYADVTPAVPPTRCTVLRNTTHPSLAFSVANSGINTDLGLAPLYSTP